MSEIRIIDADLISREKHRFPNLACEKISGFHKSRGDNVILLTSFNEIEMYTYDKVYISKVFTDTETPDWLSDQHLKDVHPNIQIGGTGFYFDKAPPLPYEIEHHMPDYHLYDGWIESLAQRKAEDVGSSFNKAQFLSQFKEYTDYSIGFLTRGCFRKCEFCVNQKYDRVFAHSPLEEFYDESRKKICLLDDNFLGCSQWKPLLESLIRTGKPFKFKQGLDERLLTDEKCEMLFNSNYDGDITFAFDNVEDYDIIQQKLELLKKYSGKKSIKYYVLVGFESTDEKDIENAFKRIDLLLQYGCLPYVMRYQSETGKPYLSSKYKGIYNAMARWSNQVHMIKKKSFREMCEDDQKNIKDQNNLCASLKALREFEKEYPDIANRYFDIRFNNGGKYD